MLGRALGLQSPRCAASGQCWLYITTRPSSGPAPARDRPVHSLPSASLRTRRDLDPAGFHNLTCEGQRGPHWRGRTRSELRYGETYKFSAPSSHSPGLGPAPVQHPSSPDLPKGEALGRRSPPALMPLPRSPKPLLHPRPPTA